MFGGRSGAAFVIIDCTSCAAASMLRSRLNWIVICVRPRALDDVIESMPAIVVNCFSSGVATAEAIVSGLAPGSEAETWIVGNSTVGSGETGRRKYPIAPASVIAMVSSVVATGRWMKGVERFIEVRLRLLAVAEFARIRVADNTRILAN